MRRDASDASLREYNNRAGYAGVGFTLTAIVACGANVLTVVPLLLNIIFGLMLISVSCVALHAASRVMAIQKIRERVPRAWPPQPLQCCICGSHAIDAIEYNGAYWADYFGRRVHDDCKDWVWEGWHPVR